MFLLEPACPSTWGLVKTTGGPYLPFNWTGYCCYWLPFHWPSKCLAPKSVHILAREFWADLVSHSLALFGCFCLCCICCMWLQCPLHTWPQEGSGRGVDQEYRVMQGMSGWHVWPGHSRWLFSGSLFIPLPNHCLLHSYLMHMTDLPAHLPHRLG